MRSLVHMRGMLRGMEREVPCEVMAIREESSDAAPLVFSRCSVIDTAEDVPDGVYTVVFDGYVVPTRKEGGLWIPGDAMVVAPTGEHSEESSQSFTNEVIEMMSFRKDHVA